MVVFVGDLLPILVEARLIEGSATDIARHCGSRKSVFEDLWAKTGERLSCDRFADISSSQKRSHDG